MKAKMIWVIALCVACLGAAALSGCTKEASKPTGASAADPAAAQKAAADKAAADKAAADKAAANKATADKAAADKTAAERAADKAAVEKAEAEVAALKKAAFEEAEIKKASAELAATEEAAARAKAEAASLPPDLVEMKAQITRMTAQIDLTMAKLEQLSTSTGSLKQPSKDALAAIVALEAETKVLAGRGEQMRDRGAAYFEDWEKQLASMSTPEVAAIATKRKDELAARYAEVLTAMQETRAAMDAYQVDMKTIRTAVEDGLTPESHKLLAQQVKGAKEKATTVKSRIEAAFEKVGQVSLIYTKR